MCLPDLLTFRHVGLPCFDQTVIPLVIHEGCVKSVPVAIQVRSPSQLLLVQPLCMVTPVFTAKPSIKKPLGPVAEYILDFQLIP